MARTTFGYILNSLYYLHPKEIGYKFQSYSLNRVYSF